MVRKEAVERWQSIWKHLLDMAYFRKNISDRILVDMSDVNDIRKWARYDMDFYLLTFDYVWQEYAQQRDVEGGFLVPKVVPELRELFVPAILFETLGSMTFMKQVFPNCRISFWEEE